MMNTGAGDGAGAGATGTMETGTPPLAAAGANEMWEDSAASSIWAQLEARACATGGAASSPLSTVESMLLQRLRQERILALAGTLWHVWLAGRRPRSVLSVHCVRS